MQYRSKDNAVMVYETVRKKLAFTSDTKYEKPLESNVLVFANANDVEQIKHYFQNKKMPVSIVLRNTEFLNTGNGVYEIKETEQKDYEILLEQLEKQNTFPEYILFLWETGKKEEIETQLDQSVYAVFHLVKALIKQKRRKKIQILYAYIKSGYDAAYAALDGFGKSLYTETLDLNVRSIGFVKKNGIFY